MNRNWTLGYFYSYIYIGVDLDPSHLFPGFTKLYSEISNLGTSVGEDNTVIID
jgi:hypothetical protein